MGPSKKATARVHSSRSVHPESGRAVSPDQFAQAVTALLKPLADPAVRLWMRAYMKNKFEFLGIKTPVLRAAIAELIRAQKNATPADLLRNARALWALPGREYQYVAVGLLSHHAEKLTPQHIPALFALVRKKSWWDSVDSLAGVIGSILKKDPAAQSVMDKAISSNNLWIRRVAIIHQLGWRGQTDSQRLFAYGIACADEKEFFIRKAIGWALRDYARHAPAEIRAFLRANRDRLSPLTVREAGKHIL